MTTTTHSHKHWTDKGGHVTPASECFMAAFIRNSMMNTMTSHYLKHVSTKNVPQYLESIQGGYAWKAIPLMDQNYNNRPSDASCDDAKPIRSLLTDPREADCWLARLKFLFKCNPKDIDLLNVIKGIQSRKSDIKAIRLAYIDMYPGHNPELDILTHAIRSVLGATALVLIDWQQNPDILIAGPYSYEITKNNGPLAKLAIYYSGENSRPNYSYCQYSVTHDIFDYGNRNFRFPYWMTEIDWFGIEVQHKNEERLDPRLVLSKNMAVPDCTDLERRLRTIVTFSSNPTALRSSIVDSIRSAGLVVNGYGRVYGRYLSGSKYSLSVNHTFCLAFENSLYPGYVTEKLFHAYRAGCIPLYWGDQEAYNDFPILKPELNLAEHNNVTEYIEFIKRLCTNPAHDLNSLISGEFISKDRAKIGPLLLWLQRLIMTMPD
jgi:hypothetical protein